MFKVIKYFFWKITHKKFLQDFRRTVYYQVLSESLKRDDLSFTDYLKMEF